jgi:pyruvate formate lyase activating enzyme
VLVGHLDAISVDFKGSGEEGFLRKYITAKGPAPILDTLVRLKRGGVHVEVTNLIVPQVGDDPEACRRLARFVCNELGPETPFHLLRFHPDYKMMEFPETPIRTLERLHAIAVEEGLKYAYLGNVWGHPLEHTYCPGCGSIAIERYGFTIRRWGLDAQNRCLVCHHSIPMVGTLPKNYEPTFVTPIA